MVRGSSSAAVSYYCGRTTVSYYCGRKYYPIQCSQQSTNGYYITAQSRTGMMLNATKRRQAQQSQFRTNIVVSKQTFFFYGLVFIVGVLYYVMIASFLLGARLVRVLNNLTVSVSARDI